MTRIKFSKDYQEGSVTLEPAMTIYGIEVPHRKVVLNSFQKEDGVIHHTPLSVVSDNYKLIPNNELQKSFETCLQEAGNGYLNYEKTNSMFNPKKLITEYRFKDVIAEPKKGDYVGMNLILENSYDGSFPVGIRLGALRLVCTNGMIVGETYSYIRKKHTQNLEIEDMFKGVVQSIEMFQNESNVWQAWTEKEITAENALSIIKADEIAERHQENILGKLMAEDVDILTLWVIYNVITAYITHEVKSAMVRRYLSSLYYQRVKMFS